MGEVEREGRVLVVRRIHVTYHLKVEPGQQEAARRAHGVHAAACPMARTVGGCVEIMTSLEMEDLAEG